MSSEKSKEYSKNISEKIITEAAYNAKLADYIDHMEQIFFNNDFFTDHDKGLNCIKINQSALINRIKKDFKSNETILINNEEINLRKKFFKDLFLQFTYDIMHKALFENLNNPNLTKQENEKIQYQQYQEIEEKIKIDGSKINLNIKPYRFDYIHNILKNKHTQKFLQDLSEQNNFLINENIIKNILNTASVDFFDIIYQNKMISDQNLFQTFTVPFENFTNEFTIFTYIEKLKKNFIEENIYSEKIKELEEIEKKLKYGLLNNIKFVNHKNPAVFYQELLKTQSSTIFKEYLDKEKPDQLINNFLNHSFNMEEYLEKMESIFASPYQKNELENIRKHWEKFKEKDQELRAEITKSYIKEKTSIWQKLGFV